jgi:stage V sporulation protein G
MEITEIRMNLTKSDTVLAFASVTFDGLLVVKGMRVLTGKNGPRVSWPSEKGKDGKFYDTVFSLNRDFGDSVKEAVLNKYGAMGGDNHDFGSELPL